MDKLGRNNEQVERFIESARNFRYDFVEPVYEEIGSQVVVDAQHAIFDVQFSASRYSAIEGEARNILRVLLKKFPEPASARERFMINPVTGMLKSAVFALAARPVVDDDTVGLVVDPFATRLGFEWRSWGVGINSKSG